MEIKVRDVSFLQLKGCAVVWDTLKAVVEADNDMKAVLIESAGLIIGSDNLSESLTVFYDEKGKKFTVNFTMGVLQDGSMSCRDTLSVIPSIFESESIVVQ